MADDRAVSWMRVLAPVTGMAADDAALAAAAAVAEPFGAEVMAAFASPDISDVTPWMGEGFLGGVQVGAVQSMRDAADEGRRLARTRFDALAYADKGFVVLESPIWASLCMEARLCDVVVFSPEPARGRGPLAEAFKQILIEERRPVFVARQRPAPGGLAAIAWDGGREASRAARSAIPWLQKCREVVVLTAPGATPRSFDARRLQDFLAARGVPARVETLVGSGEPAPLILKAAANLGADLLVAGAFGHPRFQQFIFGGATRSLVHAESGPSLFLSH